MQSALKQLRIFYLYLFVFNYALYAYFNKGVAYSFLTELTLVIGVALILIDLKNYVFLLNKGTKLILFFITVTCISVLLNIRRYPVYDVLQDASMFIYATFVFIVFYFRDIREHFMQLIFQVYKYYPTVVFASFLMVSYIPFFQRFTLFGEFPLLLYKFGDMAVHLLITTLLLLCGQIKMSKRFLLFNTFIIIYLFLIIAAYNRAGMLTYLSGMLIFLLTYRKRFSSATIFSYARIIPVVLLLVLIPYANTKVEENFQGRTVGLEQLKQNVVSIFSTDVEGSLSDNKVWRLAWWYTIITESLQPKNILMGKGVGVNLALINDIKVESESLRAPHSFHLNILARFGWIVFFVWIYWMVIHFKKIKKENPEFMVISLIIMTAFLINASFDVYLEGQVGALPFWTWIGILYINDSEAISLG